jgi:esterase/lipase superfamily enzyme
MSDQEQTIYLITNRNVLKSKNGKETGFGKVFNEKSPDELRLAKVTGTAKKWNLEVIPEPKRGNLPSKKLFVELVNRMRKKKRNCLFFVHGFNNVIKDVVERCMNFQKEFDVEVIAFSWPADEGLRGATSYRSQKHEAKLSVNALDRCLEKLNEYLCTYLTENENGTCDLTFNLALHSMGNYLLKNLMNSSVYEGETLIFDNAILMAADANNEDHAQWVDRIAHRKRIYITINEDDKALAVSRVKFGKLQKARLGHYTKNLLSTKAVYLDFTKAEGVDNSHAYFEGDLLEENMGIKEVFHKMFNGQSVEEDLNYDPHSRLYRID